MAGLAIKELEKRNNALLVWNKINKKDGKDNIFELNGGGEVNLQFNPNVKGIDKVFKTQDIEEITLLSKPKSTKMFFVDSKNKEYKLTDLKKTEEFGGGGGSGGGADDTAGTESMQCYYSALRYKLGNDLNNKNATPAKLKDKSLQDKVFAYPKTGATRFTAGDLLAIHSSGKSKALPTWIGNDGETNVYMRTANALAKTAKWSGVPYFHRGSPFMAAVYDSKKQALAFDKKQTVRKAPLSGFSDDKWNPGDIWMSSMEPNPTLSKPLDFGKGGKSCVLTFEALKKEIFELSKKQKLLGVSLKKVGKSAKVTPFNTHPTRTNNVTVDLSKFSFGQTGDFFNSADLYITFSSGKKMQFRSTASTSSWQGEVKGATAAAGKIGGGGVNFYCFDILGNTIGTKAPDSLKWSETKFSDGSHFKDMWQLYQKYSKHSKNQFKINDPVDFATFKSKANGYISKGKNAAPAFKFSKYMGLLMLEAIFTKKKGSIKEWSTQVLRYAMSNIDISTYFIKID